MKRKPRKPIDWAGIEKDYTTGDMSVRDLAVWYGLSEAGIRKKAKEKGWTRPEGAPVMPVKQRDIAVTYRVADTVATKENTDPAAIIGRGRNLVLRLLDELDATTTGLDELEQLIKDATDSDPSSRRYDAMMQAISLPSRAGTLKNLAAAAKTLSETIAPQGKKQEQQAVADRAASSGGKFAPPAAPRVVVNNG